ncbi:tautomerase family protein [Streptomyces sp. NPDC054842]
MPTIDILAPDLTVPARRAVAIRLTRYLTARGVPAGHVVVHFATARPNSLFTGGMPAEALPAVDTGLHHARVSVCVGPDRDAAFRADLAREIAAALGMTERTPFLYIEFRPTDPALVHLADGGRLRLAAPSPVP